MNITSRAQVRGVAMIAIGGTFSTLSARLAPSTICPLQVAIGLAAGLACVVTAGRGAALDRWPWLLFGFGQFLYALSALATGVARDSAFADAAKVLEAGGTSMTVLGLAAVALPARRSPLRGRVAIDLMVILGTAFVAAWTWDWITLLGLEPTTSVVAVRADLISLVMGVAGLAVLPWVVRGRHDPACSRMRVIAIAFAVSTLGDLGLITTTLAMETACIIALLSSIMTLVAATVFPRSSRSSLSATRPLTLGEPRFLDLATLVVAALVVTFVMTGAPLDDVTKPAVLLVVLALVGRHFHNARANLTLAARLAESERYYRGMIQSSRDVIVVVRDDGRVGYASPAARTLFGLPSADLTGVEVSLLMQSTPTSGAQASGPSRDRLEFQVKRPNGTRRLVEALISPSPDGDVYSLRDVTERAEMTQRIAETARRDPLTGLANRFGFEETLGAMLDSGSSASVVLCDLDGFKQVNDTSGHGAGDEILRQVGDRLARALPGTFVARIGGDEFAALLPSDISREGAIALTEHIQNALRHRYSVVGKEVELSLAAGLAYAHSTSVAEALRNADLALYEAKDAGRGQMRVFDQPMLDRAIERIELEERLRATLDEGSLTLRFQPIVDLVSREVVCAEVLVRWIADGREVLAAKDLIELAETSGCVTRLGEWVLETAIAQVARWERAGLSIPVAVNVSAQQLLRGDLAATVKSKLAGAGVNPAALTLEITESVFLSDIDAAVETLSRLRALGVRIAIDDFGTGYSCFAYLNRIPVDVLKIDRLFVDGIGDSATQYAIVRTMTTMSHDLGLRVTAEGVETQAQLDLLEQLGVECIQGFLIGRPMPADDLVTMASATMLREVGRGRSRRSAEASARPGIRHGGGVSHAG